ncbi:NAD(P)H-binding protein [Niastella sp. OAS944]|uniref:NAD(P)H-binding protein n=1 Tax=Niastella sp. OAS944 TaxID=2664089 RepID=UPI003498B5C3|nr:uncharacterized protein YbjT (DUF2867 family) [Chitinophagaceae bacterium OAS944]
MKIVLTGSLGHISRPLTQLLVSGGNEVIVISSKAERKADIEMLGASAAIGSVTNADFLVNSFTGASAVYTMVPPPANFYDPSFDMAAYGETVRNNYFAALAQAGVNRVVNLSSWGAHRSTGIGGIAGCYYMEQLLNQLPGNVTITHVRPTSFYYNMLHFIPMIKYTGKISLNYGGEDIVSLVAPTDIATAIAEELQNPHQGRTIRYVASDELSCNEIARVLGEAIGMPTLQWQRISDSAAHSNLLAAGMSPALAASVAEIQGAIHKGFLAENYKQHKPIFGKVKLTDFAKKFATVFNQK